MSKERGWRRFFVRPNDPREVSKLVDDELRYHIENLVEREISGGKTEEQARRDVMKRFADYQTTRNTLVRRLESRARAKSWRFLVEGLRQDVRIALRMLWKSPGFAATAIATIAVGIGANTAMFCVANGVLIQPLPLHEPQTLVQPTAIAPNGSEISVSIPNFRDWRESNRSFEYFGLNTNRRQTLTEADNPEMIGVRWILGDFFEALGVPPALGRWISSDETWVGGAPIAVLTHSLWQRSFGSDPDVLGKPISLDGESFTVVGVMPDSFVFPSATTEAFVPMGHFYDQMCWDDRNCSMGSWAIARLRSGVTTEAAQADMDRVVLHIEEVEGEPVAQTRLRSLSNWILGDDVAVQIWVLMGAVALVLLIACANVASLLLARGESRRREIAVRTALGAAKLRVARQFVTESLVLAAVGGVIGFGLAYAAVQALTPYVAQNVPSALAGNIRLDPTVILFVFIATTVTGLLFGLAPALGASRGDVASSIREGTRDTGGKDRQGIRSAFVVLEVAVTLVLLIGAGLMLQSLSKLQSVDKGFAADNVFTANVFLPARRYGEKEQTWSFYRDLLARVSALPEAVSASMANTVPLGGANWTWDAWPEGVPTENETAKSVLFHMVSPSHFEVMGIPLLRGRAFDSGDRDGNHRVAIIDETTAAEFWPGEDPIGKRFTFETEDDTDKTDNVYRTVVGVVNPVLHDQLDSPSNMQVYVPMDQSFHAWSRAMVVAVKTAGDPLAMTGLVRRELAALDPQVPLTRIQSMEGYVQNALSSTVVMSGLLSVFSTTALVLAALGLFGLISYSVAQRFREIGIRMALGAEAGNTVWMVASRGLKLALLGIALGICGAAALTKLLGNMLYGVDPVEPLTYGAVSVFLITVTMLASYLPARRAANVDPALVLREE